MKPHESTKVLTHGKHGLQDADGDAAHSLDEEKDADVGEGEEARDGRHAEEALTLPFLAILFLSASILGIGISVDSPFQNQFQFFKIIILLLLTSSSFCLLTSFFFGTWGMNR